MDFTVATLHTVKVAGAATQRYASIRATRRKKEYCVFTREIYRPTANAAGRINVQWHGFYPDILLN